MANGTPNISVPVSIHALHPIHAVHPTYGRSRPPYKTRNVAIRMSGTVCRNSTSHAPSVPTTAANASAAALTPLRDSRETASRARHDANDHQKAA